MFDKLGAVELQYEELVTRLGTAEIQSDAAEYRKAAKVLSEIEPLVRAYRDYRAVQKDIEGSEELVHGADADIRELAQAELEEVLPHGALVTGTRLVRLEPVR